MIALAALTAMFKIVPSPTFTVAVPLTVPGQDKPIEVRMTFRHKSRRDLVDYQARAYTVAEQSAESGAEGLYIDYVAEILDAWSGVADASGAPLPYSRDNLALLLEAYPSAGPQIVRRYTRELADARAGN